MQKSAFYFGEYMSGDNEGADQSAIAKTNLHLHCHNVIRTITVCLQDIGY